MVTTLLSVNSQYLLVPPMHQTSTRGFRLPHRPGTFQLPYKHTHLPDKETEATEGRSRSRLLSRWAAELGFGPGVQRESGVDGPFLSRRPSATALTTHGPCLPPTSLHDSGPAPFLWGEEEGHLWVLMPGLWFEPLPFSVTLGAGLSLCASDS